MKRSYHHLTYFTKNLKDKRLSIYIRHKYGTSNPLYQKTDIIIPEIAWDKTKKEVKIRDNFKEYRKRFEEIESNRLILERQLNDGEIDPKRALKELRVYKNLDSIGLREYFENTFIQTRKEGYNPDKYYSIFNQLEEGLEKTNKGHLLPVKIHYFKSKKNEIAKAFFKVNSKNTASEYLKKLNTILKEYDRETYPDKYFKDKYQTEDVEPKEAVKLNTILDAIPKIKTYKQLEAYLFWLYSFCLRGLDGQDVTLVEDKLIVEKDRILEDYIHEREGYDQQVHIQIRRKKTGARTISILFNAYPTLSILRLLKHVISITRPKELNKKDELKLFKWDRVTNKRKWDLYSDFLKGRLNHLIGASFKSTRHSVATLADRLSVSLSDQSALIGNKSRTGSIQNYSAVDNQRLDFIHLEILGQYQIIRVYITLLKHLKAVYEDPTIEIEIDQDDRVTNADEYVFMHNIDKHLSDSWQVTQRQALDRERQPLEFDLDAGVYRGVL
jgi:hypothetical protein